MTDSSWLVQLTWQYHYESVELLRWRLLRAAITTSATSSFSNWQICRQPIASAKLALSVPATGYISADPSENYELHDVTTSLGNLLNGTGGVAAHTDLGTGVVYGSRMMTAADSGNVVEIELNSSAIAALNAAIGLFGIGGSITTLDNLSNVEGRLCCDWCADRRYSIAINTRT